MTDKPLISVLCATYNHEKYVAYFINSLLNQTYENWELIFVDDCSTDNNINEIKKFSDPRIKLFQQEFNQGPGAALNKAFNESKGEIIVEIASDDYIENGYFQYLINEFSNNSNIGIIYSAVNVVDQNNKKYDEWKLPPDLDRIKLLQKLFYESNIISSPGLSARREIYQTIIPMDISMIQHQDYQWHILFLSNTDCKISSKPYINYRFIKSKGISLGSKSIACENRLRLEINRLMNSFLGIKELNLIKKITNSELCDKLPQDCYEYIWGYSALTSTNIYKRQWGYNLIAKVYADDKLRKELFESIGFKFSDFLSLAKINYFNESSSIKVKIKNKLRKIKRVLNLEN